MLQQTVSQLYESAIAQLSEEIKLYNNEADLWIVKDGISNSGGNLCLHLIGNFNHFFGAVLGNSGYVRNKDAEFTDKNVPREKLLTEIEAAKAVVLTTIKQLTEEQLNQTYPQKLGDKGDKIFTIGQLIILMTTHLNYHLGQINYHRRLLSVK